VLTILEGAHEAIEKGTEESNNLSKEIARLEEEITQERDRSKPKFAFKIINFAVNTEQRHLPQFKAFDAFGSFELRVSNAGIPSIAINWKMLVDYEGRRIQAGLRVMTAGLVITMNNDKGEKVTAMTKDRFIQPKTIRAIPQGDQARGWVMGAFVGITAARLR
jgi:hypothetical protein